MKMLITNSSVNPSGSRKDAAMAASETVDPSCVTVVTRTGSTTRVMTSRSTPFASRKPARRVAASSSSWAAWRWALSMLKPPDAGSMRWTSGCTGHVAGTT